MYKYILFYCSLVFAFGAHAQKVLTPQEYFALIKKNHPLAKQANLVIDKAKQYVVKAKGAFDPTLLADLNNKYFDGKNYFNVLQNQLKVNTPIGVQVKAGYDVNTGNFVNPENALPEAGLAYAGIGLQLGRGLFTDAQRTALKQARLYQNMGIVERDIALNQLFFEAGEAYLKWLQAAGAVNVFNDAIQVAEQRFSNVKLGLTYGDRAPVDTLEAFIQLQSRQLSFQQATVEYVNATLYLSNYLWNDNNEPITNPNEYVPPAFSDLTLISNFNLDTLQSRITNLVDQNPVIGFYNYKIGNLKLEQRLLKENLKPVVNLNYNFLTAGDNVSLSPNNYKWGFGVYFPVLIRKERAELGLNKIKINESQFELNQKRQETETKIKQSVNNFALSRTNLTNYLTISDNYNRLLQAERSNFENGESSLFMINARELVYFDAQIKVFESYTKLNESYFKILYQIGFMHQQI